MVIHYTMWGYPSKPYFCSCADAHKDVLLNGRKSKFSHTKYTRIVKMHWKCPSKIACLAWRAWFFRGHMIRCVSLSRVRKKKFRTQITTYQVDTDMWISFLVFPKTFVLFDICSEWIYPIVSFPLQPLVWMCIIT